MVRTDNYYLELQQNLVFGDIERNRKLVELGKEIGVKVVATGNVHYHLRERHQLQDALWLLNTARALKTATVNGGKLGVLLAVGNGTGKIVSGVSGSFNQHGGNR